ncbi:MAG: hypothetical protein R3343_14165 [Nitriliruptorales bacterium]|nr:hypothetical protein [Nitriliruptorales bacterium]
MRNTSKLRRLAVTVPGIALALGLGALPASAHATCSEVGLGVEVHGHHVVRDYVVGGALDWPPSGGSVGAAVAGSGAALPGGPGPGFHFPNGFAPGASFCNSQSQSPGWHVGD